MYSMALEARQRSALPNLAKLEVVRVMNLELTDAEAETLARELREII
jgi:hypothetical protein